MNILYIDPIGGIAGDMLCAALLDMGIDEEAWKQHLSSIPVEPYLLQITSTMRGAFAAKHLLFKPVVTPTSTPQQHHSPHPASWGTHHRNYRDIIKLIDQAPLPIRVQQRAHKVFQALAAAEAKIHNTPIENVHFHEVGAVDSILDILGFCIGLELLNIDKIYSAPPPLSHGQTTGEHGVIPLPAPATLELLTGWSCASGHPNHEQTTPTGAAILQALSEPSVFPSGRIVMSGYGAGTRNPQQYPNILRLALIEQVVDNTAKTIIEVKCQIDDMPSEHIPYLIEQLLDGGAVDAYTQPIVMKKGRPAFLITTLCPPLSLPQVKNLLFTHSTTFGIRYQTMQRSILQRRHEKITTEWGDVRIKIGCKDQKIVQASVEWEDARNIAYKEGISVQEVMNQAKALWRNT